MTMTHRGLDRFRKCRRCQGLDTKELATADKVRIIVYLGWCHSCNAEFGYSLNVETVWDGKGRI